MEQLSGMPTHWRGIKTIEQAKQLVDFGVILTWKDMKTLTKVFTDAQQQDLMRHIAIRLGERTADRLSEEILIESLLVWMANISSESVMQAFLEELLLQPNNFEACSTLVEVAITAEVADLGHQEDIFAMAVALICELGLAIHSVKQRYPQEFPSSDKLLANIATYLLSVSNSSNNCIRLSLVHYFGVMEQGAANKNGFNRIMSRFGHTVLEHLFTLLFNKKTEAVALQYLLENIPYVLGADNHSQKIMHETFKFYMLKKPERFALFVQTFSKYLQSLPKSQWQLSSRVFMQHLAILLKVASEVNHKELGRELMCAIAIFDDSTDRRTVVQAILGDSGIRVSFHDFIKKLVNATPAATSNVSSFEEASFRSSKRGRKPSFAKAGALKTIEQVNFLGNQQIAKAS